MAFTKHIQQLAVHFSVLTAPFNPDKKALAALKGLLTTNYPDMFEGENVAPDGGQHLMILNKRYYLKGGAIADGPSFLMHPTNLTVVFPRVIQGTPLKGSYNLWGGEDLTSKMASLFGASGYPVGRWGG